MSGPIRNRKRQIRRTATQPYEIPWHTEEYISLQLGGFSSFSITQTHNLNTGWESTVATELQTLNSLIIITHACIITPWFYSLPVYQCI